MDEQQEQGELGAWQQVEQLCGAIKQGDPNAITQIEQICEQQIQAQGQEMAGQPEEGGGEAAQPGNFEEQMLAAHRRASKGE